MQNLNVLSVSDNSFTGSLDFVSSLSAMEELIVAGNSLTGTLPTALSSMALLKVILLSDSLFIGNPDNIFNSSIQVLVTAVDFSANDFTGPKPTNAFSFFTVTPPTVFLIAVWGEAVVLATLVFQRRFYFPLKLQLHHLITRVSLILTALDCVVE